MTDERKNPTNPQTETSGGAATEAPPAPTPEQELKVTPPVNMRNGIRAAWVGAITVAFVCAVGMIESFDSSRLQIVDTLTFGLIVLHLIPFWAGYAGSKPPPTLEGYAEPKPDGRNVLAGTIAGLGTGLGLCAFLLLFETFNLRGIFTNVGPAVLDLVSYGQSLGVGLLLILGIFTALGALGGSFHLLPYRLRKSIFGGLGWLVAVGLFRPFISQVLKGISDLLGEASIPLTIRDWAFPTNGLSVGAAVVVAALAFLGYYFLGSRRGRDVSRARERYEKVSEERRKTWNIILLVLAFLFAIILPQILGSFLSEVLDIAALFTVTALGLNIVVGYAGLLDLGYVAFFIVGAYTTAIITSPLSPAVNPEWTFWAAIPFVIAAAALAGMLVGAPVLRMRGDYLAIVTLGFGEIARIVAVSQAAEGFTGGAQGIRQIPDISFFGYEIVGPEEFFYLVLVMFAIAAYASWALQNSRVGRAWVAMREDEPVAEVMGVNVVVAKLTAFVMGAILGSLGGALFAAKLGIVFPQRLDIVLSIVFLVIVIVGGMGSVPGVIVGGLVLVSVPEFLREFEAYRFLLYGTLLIWMMLKRPEGFIPSRRRAQEIREEEMQQDAWLRQETEKQELEEAAQTTAPPEEKD